MAEMRERLERLGFEILDDPREKLVDRIGSVVLEWVNMTQDRPRLSTLLSDKMACDYSLLSKSFTEVKGMTIEQYMKLLRVERVKEELCYGERSIAEISYLLGFSSPAHLSTQFKSVTGLSPRAFQLREKDAKMNNGRKSLDMI